MADITRLAIIGAGRIAQDHVRAARAIAEVEIAVVIDPDMDAARRLAGQGEVVGVGASLDDVPEDVAGAVVCSPTSIHAEQARSLVDRGIGVLVEKPLSHDLDESAALLSLAARRSVPLMPAQVLRHLPLIEPVRDTISSGRFGAPLQAIERRLVDRGESFPWWRELPAFLVSHWGSHSVDLVCHLFRDEPVRVVCEADSVRSPYGVVDDFTLLARFRSGLRMTSSMSFSSRTRMHDLVLIGTGATIVLDCYRSVSVDGEVVFEGEEDEILALGFQRQMQAFVNRLRGAPAPDGDSVLPSLRALAAAERAALAGDGGSVLVV